MAYIKWPLSFIFFFSLSLFSQDELNLPQIPSADEISQTIEPPKSDCVDKAKLMINGNRLNECYRMHPIFLEAIALISDDDFKSKKLSKKRKANIKRVYEEKRQSVRSCLDDILRYVKEQNDKKNENYVIKRMREISSIVYSIK
jgi:hypothetical protein